MVGPGLFSYYASGARLALPVDVDDTACASAVLGSVHPYFAWGQNVRALLGSRNSQGLFQTWFEPINGHNNVDAGVNANVIVYLGQRYETEAALIFLEKALLGPSPELSSPYYPDGIILAYLAVRAARRAPRLLPAVRIAGRRIAAEQLANGSFGSDLRTACGAIVLGETAVPGFWRAVAHLLCSQGMNGAWGASPLYRSRNQWFGHDALTTAISLDALLVATLQNRLINEVATG
jgi:hypothetical protein